MKAESGQSTSLWMATAEVPAATPLLADARADVCVVGAGIAGLTTAYLLAREGRSVIVLEGGAVAGGETARTTAHLVDALDDRYFTLERLHGERGAELAAASHRRAIDRIERIVHDEAIRCDFERLDGYLFVPPGDPFEVLERELAAAHRAGLSDVRLVDPLPYAKFNFGPALHFPRQAQLHALEYMAGLAAALTRNGGTIHAPAHVVSVDEEAPVRVVTTHGPAVTADAVVVATNSPVHTLLGLHTKQAAYRTYVVGARVRAGRVPRFLLWDTGDPYHYVRLQSVRTPVGLALHDILLVGGEDHKTGQADDFETRYRRLEDWTCDRFPQVDAFEYRWSGQIMEPVDGLAFIGRSPGSEHVFVATGDSGNGMTHGTIAGMLITDFIAGRDNEWAVLYEPSRRTLGASPSLLEENANVAVTPSGTNASPLRSRGRPRRRR